MSEYFIVITYPPVSENGTTRRVVRGSSGHRAVGVGDELWSVLMPRPLWERWQPGMTKARLRGWKTFAGATKHLAGYAQPNGDLANDAGWRVEIMVVDPDDSTSNFAPATEKP